MVWIFGYGSLIWRPDFPYEGRAIARMDGWVRRFSQGSPDHRGTPDFPGRVVNLLRDHTQACVGLAFRVSEEHRAPVLAQLDIRESGGYDRQCHQVTMLDGARADAIVYIAPPDNPFHLGLHSLPKMAEQIRLAKGPSGPNREYLFRLQAALAGLGIQDSHINELAAAVHLQIARDEDRKGNSTPAQ